LLKYPYIAYWRGKGEPDCSYEGYWHPNGTFEKSGATSPLAEFAGNLWRQPHICWLLHQPQGLLNLLLGKKGKKGGLFQLHRETLSKGTVENGLAGRI
jgi:hypothetical protein